MENNINNIENINQNKIKDKGIDLNKSVTEEKNSLIQELIQLITQKLHKEKILVIDRFEGNFAICENRDTLEMVNIDKNDLPKNAKEGDIIKYKNNTYELDEQERSKIENRLNEKMKNLFDN